MPHKQHMVYQIQEFTLALAKVDRVLTNRRCS